MADVGIILNNTGNNIYAQAGREFISSPIRTSFMRIILSSADQINNLIMIRNGTSFGGQSNRDLSLRNYVKATDKTDLVIDVPLDPPLIIDGETYFQVDLEPNSEMDFLFYFDQVGIESLLE